METYVVGIINKTTASRGDINKVIERLGPVGYSFAENAESYEFRKNGRVESVITEMVPVCERNGLDVEDFQLVEYKKNSGEERSRYECGRIIRE